MKSTMRDAWVRAVNPRRAVRWQARDAVQRSATQAGGTHRRQPSAAGLRTRLSPALLALSLGVPAAARGEDKPLWELGLGVAALSFPDYRGSEQRKDYLLPAPYIVYRGEFLKADRKGIRGQLFDTDRLDLAISLSASQPVSSEDNRARAGMPDLQPTVEIGPSLEARLWRSADHRYQLDLRLPARLALSVERSPESVGWIATPLLNLDVKNPAGYAGWNLGLQAGPIFASRRQHEYFYGVDPRYATATRPAYSASGGYSGSQFLAAVSKRFSGYWVGGFVRYDDLHGASFADSPLVTSKSYFAGGVAISWILGESSVRVPAEE